MRTATTASASTSSAASHMSQVRPLAMPARVRVHVCVCVDGELAMQCHVAASGMVAYFLLLDAAAEPYDEILLRTCLGIFQKFDKWPQAMQIALKLNKSDIIRDIFKKCNDKCVSLLTHMKGRKRETVCE